VNGTDGISRGTFISGYTPAGRKEMKPVEGSTEKSANEIPRSLNEDKQRP